MKYKTMKQKNKRKGIKIIRIETVGTYTHSGSVGNVSLAKWTECRSAHTYFRQIRVLFRTLRFFHIHSFIHSFTFILLYQKKYAI